MPYKSTPHPASKATIAQLGRPAQIADQHPIAARFIYALRLIAVHDRAGRDPVPELAMRLGGVDIAAKSLALALSIKAIWPEDVHVARFCCNLLSHDEATMASMLASAATRDRFQFERALEGLLRPARIERLWDNACELVAAELRAS